MLKNILVLVFVSYTLGKRNRNSTEWEDPKDNPSFESNLNNSRNIFYSCIVCSYSFFLTNGTDSHLSNIIETYTTPDQPEQTYMDQGKVWKRIQLDGVKHCANKQTASGAKQMYLELQQPGFSVTKYFDLMDNFNFTRYENRQANLEFDQSDETLWTMMEDFQEKMREEQMEQFDEDDMNLFMQQQAFEQNYQPKINMFGQPVSEGSTGYILLATVFGLFFLIMILAYRVLSKQEEIPQKRQKKQKKQN